MMQFHMVHFLLLLLHTMTISPCMRLVQSVQGQHIGYHLIFKEDL